MMYGSAGFLAEDQDKGGVSGALSLSVSGQMSGTSCNVGGRE